MTMTPLPAYSKKKQSSLQLDDTNRGEPSPTAQLAEFAANLEFDDIPQPTVRRTEELFLDWVGSALAGKGGRPVEAMERFARMMGPQHGGESEVLDRKSTRLNSSHLVIS